jgi:hypothetical protein
MNTNTTPSLPVDTGAGQPGSLVRSWTDFWFTPTDPIGLHVVRVLAGLLFLAWLLPFGAHQEAFFGSAGWFDRQAYKEAARLAEGAPPRATWSLLYLCGSNPTRIHALYWGTIAVLALFTLGICTRLTAVLTWLAVGSFLVNPAIGYGADSLLVMLAFYLMVGYLLLGQRSPGRSLPFRLLGPWVQPWRTPAGAAPSYAANLALRLLQVHFAIVVVTSGLHKLQFGDWWAGVAFWYPLHDPFTTTADSIRAEASRATRYLFVLSLMQYAVLGWQIGFPAFAWRKRWRPVLLGGALLGWVGSLAIDRQPLFGPVFCIACLAYVSAQEWRAFFARLARAIPTPAEQDVGQVSNLTGWQKSQVDNLTCEERAASTGS